MNIVQRVLWWGAGANLRLLRMSPNSWNRFYVIGLNNYLNTIIAALSISYSVRLMSGNLLAMIIVPILWGLLVFNVGRFISIINGTETTYQRLVVFIPRIAFAILLAILVVKPIEIIIFHNQLNVGTNADYLQTVRAYEQFKTDNPYVNFLSFNLTLCSIMLQILPIIIHLSPKGEYEIRVAGEIQSAYLEEQIGMSQLNKRANEVLKQKHIRDEVEGLDFYIDYYTLPLNEINSLIESLNNIYNSVYQMTFLPSIVWTWAYENRIAGDFKMLPEDTLVFGSIETGNSITFKVTTGWAPKFDVIKGNIVVSIPKGSLSLLVTGYIIKAMFDYGVSNYKTILEIQKLEGENVLLKEQINQLHNRLDEAPEGTKVSFQAALTEFFKATVQNSNFKQVSISQDSLVAGKLKDNQITIGQ